MAATLNLLASFNGANGEYPHASLLADAAGDLFGTTEVGGTSGDGTVFEIVKTAGGYSSTPLVIVSFNGSNGHSPLGNLISDSAGNLFGTTYSGGAYGYGTVFEIAKTASGYSSTPTVLATFSGTNGKSPEAGLIMDAAGDLFGTLTSISPKTRESAICSLGLNR